MGMMEFNVILTHLLSTIIMEVPLPTIAWARPVFRVAEDISVVVVNVESSQPWQNITRRTLLFGLKRITKRRAHTRTANQ